MFLCMFFSRSRSSSYHLRHVKPRQPALRVVPPGHAEFAVASSGYFVGISAHHSLGTAVQQPEVAAEIASVSRGISGKSAHGTIGKLTTSSDFT